MVWKIEKKTRQEQSEDEAGDRGRWNVISRKCFLHSSLCCTHCDDEKQREEGTSIMSSWVCVCVCVKERKKTNVSGSSESSSLEINSSQLFSSLFCSGYNTNQIQNLFSSAAGCPGPNRPIMGSLSLQSCLVSCGQKNWTFMFIQFSLVNELQGSIFNSGCGSLLI